MGSGSIEEEPAGERPRLAPQPDGYANHGHTARAHGRRQRPIRFTITILLVIPLVSLVALWAYAASSTVGGAIAKRNSGAENADVGGATLALAQRLDAERAYTFAWQNSDGRLPRATLVGLRARTDEAIAAFRSGQAKAASAEPAAVKPLAAKLLSDLNEISVIRMKVDDGAITPLAAFQGYNSVLNEAGPFAIGLVNPDESVSLFSETEAEVQEGEATEDVSREDALVAGALAAGGFMSADELRVFAQTVDDQRQLEQEAVFPLDWQDSPDPYPAVFASRPFQEFTALQNSIVAARPGRIPVSPDTWNADFQQVIGLLTQAETTARLGVTRGVAHAGDIVLLRLFLVGGAGLLAVLVSSVLLLRFGNRIARELLGLRGAARALASQRLPSVVQRLRAGDSVDVDTEAPPLALRTRTREVTETADAFSAVQRTAVLAAVEEAELRKGISSVFRSLARRNQSLLQRQLKMLDQMERSTYDPDVRAQLFRLDQLTTRMRRQAEGLIILSGAGPGWGPRAPVPVPVADVLRGAIEAIEDYTRVDLITDSRDLLQGGCVADVQHLLAELVENAVLFSPPTSRVRVRGSRVASGYAVEVEDGGLGIPAEMLAALNERLAQPPEFDLADSDQLGLVVVSRLASRQGIKVTLQESVYGGTMAVVLLPQPLFVPEAEAAFRAAESAFAAHDRPGWAAGAETTVSVRNGWWPTGPDSVSAFPPASPPAPERSPLGPDGLPGREPMTSLAPEPRLSTSGAPNGPGTRQDARTGTSPAVGPPAGAAQEAQRGGTGRRQNRARRRG